MRLSFKLKNNYPSNSKPKGELQSTKKFHCSCSRCVAPLEASEDRFLDGFLCSIGDVPKTREDAQTDFDAAMKRAAVSIKASKQMEANGNRSSRCVILFLPLPLPPRPGCF